VLTRHAPSLRVLFSGLAKISYEFSRVYLVKKGAAPPCVLPAAAKNKLAKRGLSRWVVVPGHVSFSVWRQALSAMGFVRLEIREIAMCFLYSVMAVVDRYSDSGRVKEQNLPFESFLEAIVRLATRVLLPTDEMLSDAMLTHAGPCMAQLEASDAAAIAGMAHDQACEWGGVPDDSVAGGMPRRVEHLIDIIMRKVKLPKDPTSFDSPLGVLTRREFRHWAVSILGVKGQLPFSWEMDGQVGEEDTQRAPSRG